MVNKQKKFIIIFDEYNITPQVAYCFGEAVTKDISNYLGINISEAITFWKDWNSQLICLDRKSYQAVSKKIFNLIKSKPEVGLKINRDIIKVADETLFYNIIDSNASIRDVSNEDLFKFYNNFFIYAKKQFVSGSIPMILEVIEPHLSGYMLNYLITKEKNIEMVNKAFSTLTYSLDRSPIQQEEIDLLNIVLKIKNQNDIKNLRDVSLLLKNKKSPIYRAMIKHHQKYHCLAHDFRGPDMSIDDLKIKIVNLSKKGLKVKKRLLEIVEDEKKIKAEQKKLIKKYEIDRHHQKLFKVLQGFLFSKLYRKTKYTHACYFYNQVCSEIAKRIYFTQKQVWFMLPDEVNRFLCHVKNIEADKINKRFSDSVILSRFGETKFITDKRVKKIFNQIDLPKTGTNVNLIKGQVSYSGKVKGIVKIVLVVADVKKINAGDILVSIATNPDLLPAMKKSGAIITDAGGITCHAAIVSRELKKPCIIGTKIATRALKDGDLVEVNADKGEVKIIKRK